MTERMIELLAVAALIVFVLGGSVWVYRRHALRQARLRAIYRIGAEIAERNNLAHLKSIYGVGPRIKLSRPTLGDAIRAREMERRRLSRIRVNENGHMAEKREE